MTRKLERVARSTAGRVAAADDRQGRQMQRVDITPYVQNRWRIPKLSEQFRVVVVAKRNRLVGIRRPRHFCIIPVQQFGSGREC